MSTDLLAYRRHWYLTELLDGVSQARLAPFVKPAARCLELGTGGGSLARWLAAQVGERGHVTALDLNGDTLLPPGPFDVIHARLVLGDLPQRRAILHKLVARLAPLGVLVVGDWRTMNADPVVLAPSDEDAELYRRYQWTVREQVLAQCGTDNDWAPATYLAMRGEGLADVHTTVTAEYWRGGGTGLAFVRTMLHELAQPLLAAGLTEDELEALGRLLDDPCFVVHGHSLYYSSARKTRGLA